MPVNTVEPRSMLPGESSVSVNFFFNPRALRAFGLDNEEDLKTAVDALITEQTELARPALRDAILEYVSTQQALIDKTRS